MDDMDVLLARLDTFIGLFQGSPERNTQMVGNLLADAAAAVREMDSKIDDLWELLNNVEREEFEQRVMDREMARNWSGAA